VSQPVEALLRQNPLYRRLSEEDRRRLAELALIRSYSKGATIFTEGEPSEFLHTIVSGRAKVVKLLPGGKELILEILGPGDPLGAVAAYESRPYPASAAALEQTTCLLLRRGAFLALLETCPSLVRGLLVGLSFRLLELTQRLAEVAGSRVETRFAHLFLKLAERLGRPQGSVVEIPLALSRQDLADLTGTTIETCIRVMSRWGKQGLVRTGKDGFAILDRAALERVAQA
jgi:CRP/FNR family transcriptional regulator, nitrogen oxide reductase regulator